MTGRTTTRVAAGARGRRPTALSTGRDPLGRRYGQGSSGADESADVTVPEERERQRTQAIQEELRRRGGERAAAADRSWTTSTGC